MNRWVRALLPVAILAAGALVAYALVHTRSEPPREPREEVSALVEVVVAEMRAHEVEVRASGSVTPARQVALTPEIAGRVVWISDKLVPGGRFEEGEVMVRLDARDHELAVRQQRAEVDRARTELEIERGRASVAEREWEIFAEDDGAHDGDGALALREPQLRTARAAVEGAESGLERARLNVRRARLKAPFNALVIERNVDVGQHAAPGAPVATLVGTDEFWVRTSIPIRELGWIDVPGVGGVGEGEGSPARVRHRFGSEETVREGRVIKLLGDVDPAGRMARVLVALEDPYGLADSGGERPGIPLLAGSYVDVEILADEVPAAVEIPRIALRDDRRVFTMDDGDRLEVRDVSVIWRDRDSVLVGSGLEDGDRVVVSPLPAPVEGMKLRSRDGTADMTGAGVDGPESAGDPNAGGGATGSAGTP